MLNSVYYSILDIFSNKRYSLNAAQRSVMLFFDVKKVVVPVVFSAMLLMVSTAYAQSAMDFFKQGIRASAKGDNNQALQMFKKAEQAGLATASLKYNMAVSYYKLQQYEQARLLFAALTDDPAFEQFAYFNLGLVANKQRDEATAIRWFRRAYRSGQSKNIRALSAEALKRLGVSPARPKQQRPGWSGFVAGSLGYDSNVTLVNNDLLGATSESDTAMDLFASAGRWLKGDMQSGVRLVLGANLQKYSTLDQNDFGGFSVRVSRYDRLGDWRLRLGGSWREIYFDGNEYERIVSAYVYGRKSLSKTNQMRLRYKLSRIQATSALYDYLDGWRQQVRLGLRQYFQSYRTRYYYELELNNRADFNGTVDPFISFSPTRHTLRATSWWKLTNQWETRLDGRYRYSHYNDDNILFGGISERREDRQLRVALRLSRKLNRQWDINTEYTHTNNDSNVDRKSYDRDVIMLGFTWLY
jgi:tetratricopeptide (TPR) repeat protein